MVADDAAQGITHVVRGQDLTDNTARQILLQEALGLSCPQYLHTPLVLGVNGEKLSKQNGAQALDLSSPMAIWMAMQSAASALGLSTLPHAAEPHTNLSEALTTWTQEWSQSHMAITP